MNQTKIIVYRRTTATLTLFTALLILLFAPGHIQFPAPLHIIELSEIFDSLLTAAIFYASVGLLRGRRNSWLAACSILTITTGWEILVSRHTLPLLATVPAATLCVIIATRHLYTQKSERSNNRLRLVGLITIITTTTGCIGYLIIALTSHRHFSLIDAIVQSLQHMYSLNTSWESILHPHHHTPVVAYAMLFVIGIINYSLAAIAFLQPAIDEQGPISPAEIEQKLTLWSNDSDDFFKVFPSDKQYFTSAHSDGFIAYARHEDICFILADPIAKSLTERAHLLHEFQLWCHNKHLRCGAIPVSQKSTDLYESNGFSLLKIGDNAVVDLKEFTSDTVRNKHFRNVLNRFEKSGATITRHRPPHSAALMRRLSTLSDEWLKRDHEERGFALGYFDTAYLQRCDVFVARNATNEPTGFINIIPSYLRTVASFDLMRTGDYAPKNTIDFLLASVCISLQEHGHRQLNFGLAPLTGLEKSDNSTEKILNLLAGLTKRWYGFHGLRQFKNKFKPVWQPTYLAYEGNSYHLVIYTIALMAILDNTPPQQTR